MNGQRDASMADRADAMFKCLLYSDRRKKSNEPTANHIHSQCRIYGDPARASDKRKKTSGCGWMLIEKVEG